jgi:hypothetical protein
MPLIKWITNRVIIRITIRIRRGRKRYTKTGCHFLLHPCHASSSDADH